MKINYSDVIDRPVYLERIFSEETKDHIIAVSGIRRCGKTYLLYNIAKYLVKTKGFTEDIFAFIDFTSYEDSDLKTKETFQKFVINIIKDKKELWLLLDEVQELEDYKDTIVGLFKSYRGRLHIVLTGSNSKMQSIDIIKSFGANCFEVKLYPLSFKEFVDFNDSENKLHSYYKYGGFPLAVKNKGSYQSFDMISKQIIINDTFLKNQSALDEKMLLKFAKFFSAETSHIFVPENLINYVKSNNKEIITNEKIEEYVKALVDSFYLIDFSEPAFGKSIFSTITNRKIYCIDFALANYISEEKVGDGQKLETMVMVDLLYRNIGFKIGKIWNEDTEKEIEIDFVTLDKSLYIQCCKEITPKRIKNEFGAFDKVLDKPGRKIMITDSHFDRSVLDDKYNDVEIIQLKDWLLR